MTTYDTTVEMYAGPVTGWVDITSKVRLSDGIDITRGLTSEANGAADHSSCTMTVSNDGRFSPRNPTGIYYGKINRNTPLRVSTPAEDSFLLTGPGLGGATTPDSSGISVTGDIDLRVEAEGDWLGQTVNLIGKYSAGNVSYALSLLPDGSLRFSWSPTANSDGVSTTSTIPVPSPFVGRKAVRVTLDVSDVTSGWVCTYWYSDSINGTWVALGNAWTAGNAASATSIADSTQPLTVGSVSNAAPISAGASRLRFYSAQVRNGIGGSLVANPVFTGRSDGTTGFTDAQGNAWTVTGDAVLRARDYRFWGEIAEWPQEWDISGRDVTVPLVAGGLLRRLSQGANPLESVYYRQATGGSPFSNLVAYWPVEDGKDSTRLASGLPSGSSGLLGGGEPNLASSSEFPCSAPIAVLNNGSLRFPMDAYTVTNNVQVRWLGMIDSSGVPANSVYMRVHTTGTAARWDFVVVGTNGLKIIPYDGAGTALTPAETTGWVLNGVPYRYHFDLQQSGANISFQYAVLAPGAAVGYYASGTLTGRTFGQVHRIEYGPGLNMAGSVVGHVTVQNATTTIFEYTAQLNAYQGETAGARIERLCAEEGIPVTVIGANSETTAMGYQQPSTLVDLLTECAESDAGILADARDNLGLYYRSRASMERRNVSLTINHSNGDVSTLQPVDDDRSTRNDVTVGRQGGSSARVESTLGRLSTAAPPTGVGRYSSSLTRSLASDFQCENVAGWELSLGTVDEARFPNIPINLQSPNFVSSATRRGQVARLELGDMVRIEDLPPWLPPDDVDQNVVGYTESVGEFGRSISLVCSPASPYNVGVWYTTAVPNPSRWTSDYTKTNGIMTTTDTTMDVLTETGPVWAFSGAFDVMVAGERMTVTGISGTGTGQVFTVTRSVNGVVKEHDAEEQVELWPRVTWGL